MRRRPIDPLLLVIVVLLVIVAVVLLVIVAVACVTPVNAQAPAWRGELRAAPAASWWFAEGLAVAPVVVVRGGTGGLGLCEDDGSGITLRCTLWAQGDWRAVTADGVLVAARWRLALPMMRMR